MAEIEVVDNVERHRYEARAPGEPAFLNYRLEPGTVVLVHTQVPKALEGHGIGQALVRHALDDARARGLGVVPMCPFVEAWIKRHPEYADLVQPPSR
jgi:predicted GNAT family acetyltransferase